MDTPTQVSGTNSYGGSTPPRFEVRAAITCFFDGFKTSLQPGLNGLMTVLQEQYEQLIVRSTRSSKYPKMEQLLKPTRAIFVFLSSKPLHTHR